MKTKRIFATVLIIALIVALAAGFAACNKDDGSQAAAKEKTEFVKASASSDGYATVYMPADRDVKIMVLSDPQVDLTEKYNNVGSLGTDATYAFIEDFVKAAAPDLVIINGDMVMDNTFMNNAPYFKRYADIFTKLEIPWMPVFGNHDCEQGWGDEDADEDTEMGQLTKANLVTYLSSFEYCLMSSDETCGDGEGNYFVNVRKKDGSLVYSLCAFDCVYNPSYGGLLSGDSTYLYVPTAKQISWYKDTVNALSDAEYGTDRATDKVVPSMIFNHVGIPEFKTAWTEAWNGGEPTSAYHYGRWFDGNYTNKESGVATGSKFFNQVLALGSTKAIFMCHHHDNDFSVDYKGVRLTFGQHSGLSHNYRTTHDDNGVSLSDWTNVSFARVDDYGNQRGGTQIKISAAQAFEISPVYASEIVPNYAEDYYIDYDAVAARIDASDDYAGTVKRGTERKWRLEASAASEGIAA